MAEHMLRDELKRRSVGEDVEVTSAGVSARRGQPAARQTISVLRDEGITSVQGHQSRPVGEVDLDKGDLVLTMTRGHKKRLGDVPEGVTVQSLKEFAGEGGSIPDPYGQDTSAYRELYEDMVPLVEAVADWVEQRTSEDPA
jgi:protein-tyrosine-phosphatase